MSRLADMPRYDVSRLTDMPFDPSEKRQDIGRFTVRSLWYFLNIRLESNESQDRHIFQPIILLVQITQNAGFLLHIFRIF